MDKKILAILVILLILSVGAVKFTFSQSQSSDNPTGTESASNPAPLTEETKKSASLLALVFTVLDLPADETK
jgi:hypothetical protein